MYPTERKLIISEVLQKRNIIAISELSKILQVSEATIRRDIKDMAKEGKISTHYGVARLDEKPAEQRIPYVKRSEMLIDEKNRIAKKALEYVELRESIFLDAGTTCMSIATKLLEWDAPLTVVTSAFNIAQVLQANRSITVILTGGVLRNTSDSMVGSITEDALKKLNISKAFIGVAGISIENGITCSNLLEARARQIIYEKAKMRIIVADHTKFDRISLVTVCPIDKINILITDKLPSQEILQQFQKHRIELIVA